jgi:hypothetical protein
VAIYERDDEEEEGQSDQELPQEEQRQPAAKGLASPKKLVAELLELPFVN